MPLLMKLKPYDASAAGPSDRTKHTCTHDMERT